MTVAAIPYVHEDRLVEDVRGYAQAASGRGMHVTVPGEHLKAVLARMDRFERQAREPRAVPLVASKAAPAWQEPLAGVLPIVDDILQSSSYKDLIGVSLLDALDAWAARNGTTLDADTLAAVKRSLAGG